MEIAEILERTAERIPKILIYVNANNVLLYEMVIPNLFHHLYKIKAFTAEEEHEIELVNEPPDGEHYTVTASPDDVLPDQAAKSFHLDTYAFDSRPEQDIFWRLLRDGRVSKVYFTGMLTHGQSDFYIQYIDPDTRALRSYYPDFLIQKEDGFWVIVEVKGDHQIEDPVVLAKAAYAEQLAVANGMKYKMLPGTRAKQGSYDYFFNGEALPAQPDLPLS